MKQATEQTIEIRVQKLAELFNSIDPTPFHQRSLDADVDEYLRTWALEYSEQSPFHILVHIETRLDTDPTQTVIAAIHNHYQYRSERSQRRLRLLLIEGRTSFLIGLFFLTLCLMLAKQVGTMQDNDFSLILKESLTIGGWVAMWHPMQKMLYDWWPLLRRKRIYRNLSMSRVEVRWQQSQTVS